MNHPVLTRTPGTELLQRLERVVARERETTAEMLALIAEVDRRRLFARESQRSMFRYCVRKLHMSEDEAYKRIQAARAARRHPVILEMLADGRLHLTAVVLLAPVLGNPGGATLLAEAVHRSKPEIQELLAKRFPRPDLPALEQPLVPAARTETLVPEPVFMTVSLPVNPAASLLAANTGQPSQASAPAVAPIAPPAPPARVAPLAPERYGVQFTCSKAVHEKLCHARALLGHALPAGELPDIFERALDALIEQLERRKFGKAARVSGADRRGSSNPRHIHAAVRREVAARDGFRCTYVSDAGERCDSCTQLEYDHIRPVASGGASTAENLRLRCRTHNQYEAECTFGADFMREQREKREAARGTPAGARH
jgi:hypothetical protein